MKINLDGVVGKKVGHAMKVREFLTIVVYDEDSKAYPSGYTETLNIKISDLEKLLSDTEESDATGD